MKNANDRPAKRTSSSWSRSRLALLLPSLVLAGCNATRVIPSRCPPQREAPEIQVPPPGAFQESMFCLQKARTSEALSRCLQPLQSLLPLKLDAQTSQPGTD